MSSKLPKAYIHLDFETTTLQAFRGHARSYGMVITNYDLQPFGQASHEEWVHPDLWNSKTLDWAAKTYGPEFIQSCMDKGLTDWRHVWAHMTDMLNQDIREFTGVFGEHELWLVVNHPEFDFTIMKVMYEMLTRECPIKYNHCLDMQSLMIGHSSGYEEGFYIGQGRFASARDCTDSSEALRERYDSRGGKENVTHNALEDALAQVAMLASQGVRLPE